MKRRSRKFYDVLGVKPEASQGDIKQAFRSKAKDCHPDHHPGNAVKENEFKQLSAAYHVLGDAESRRQYDEHGEAPPIDNSLAEAYQLIVASFRQIRDIEGDNIFYIDPLKKLTEHFSSVEREQEGLIRKLGLQNEKIDKLLEKLVHKNGKNQSILHSALIEESRQNETEIEKVKRGIKVLQKARKILFEYSFSADKRDLNVNDLRSSFTSYAFQVKPFTPWGTTG